MEYFPESIDVPQTPYTCPYARQHPALMGSDQLKGFDNLLPCCIKLCTHETTPFAQVMQRSLANLQSSSHRGYEQLPPRGLAAVCGARKCSWNRVLCPAFKCFHRQTELVCLSRQFGDLQVYLIQLSLGSCNASDPFRHLCGQEKSLMVFSLESNNYWAGDLCL